MDMKRREKYGNDNPTAVRSDPSLKPVKEEVSLPTKAEEVNPTDPMMPLQAPMNPLPPDPMYVEAPSMQPSADMHGSFSIPFGVSQPSQPGMFHEVVTVVGWNRSLLRTTCSRLPFRTSSASTESCIVSRAATLWTTLQWSSMMVA